MNSDTVINTLNRRVSIRNYKKQVISDELLDKIIEAARRSPTSNNLQAYSLIIVKNQETKKELAKLAGGQKHIETCDTFIAICADINRLEIACNMHNKTLYKNLELSMVSIVDAALLGMSLSLAADSFGLGTVMIGGMRNYPKDVAKLLSLPLGVFVVFGLCIGWPENIPDKKPRLPKSVVVYNEHYKSDNIEDNLKIYDEELNKYYNNSIKAAWTSKIANKFSEPRRNDLKSILNEFGFVFE